MGHIPQMALCRRNHTPRLWYHLLARGRFLRGHPAVSTRFRVISSTLLFRPRRNERHPKYRFQSIFFPKNSHRSQKEEDQDGCLVFYQKESFQLIKTRGENICVNGVDHGQVSYTTDLLFWRIRFILMAQMKENFERILLILNRITHFKGFFKILWRWSTL